MRNLSRWYTGRNGLWSGDPAPPGPTFEEMSQMRNAAAVRVRARREISRALDGIPLPAGVPLAALLQLVRRNR